MYFVYSDKCHFNTGFTFESFNLEKDSLSVANENDLEIIYW